MMKLFKMALGVPKNSLELECTHQEKEKLALAAAEFNLTRKFACFSQLDKSVRL